MIRIKLTAFFCLSMAFAFCLSGCGSAAPAAPQDAPETEPSAPPAASPETTQEQEAEATWVVEIDDTQQITDEEGVIWNYTLTLYASKPGGVDATGEYTGEATLKIEPDFDSVRQLAANEGAELLSMLFDFHAECDSLSFEMVPYSQDAYATRMKAVNPDNPLAALSLGIDIDDFALVSAAFTATQVPVNVTLESDGTVASAEGPGSTTQVAVPTEISTYGAAAYCYFYGTPHQLARAFSGTVTGDVLP